MKIEIANIEKIIRMETGVSTQILTDGWTNQNEIHYIKELQSSVTCTERSSIYLHFTEPKYAMVS